MTNNERILEAMPVIEYEAQKSVGEGERPHKIYSFTCPLDFVNEFIDVERMVDYAIDNGDISDSGVEVAGCIAVTVFEEGACEAVLTIEYDDYEEDDLMHVGHIDLAKWLFPEDAPAWWAPMFEKVPKCSNEPTGVKVYCDMPCEWSHDGFCTKEAIAIDGSVYPGVGICADIEVIVPEKEAQDAEE